MSQGFPEESQPTLKTVEIDGHTVYVIDDPDEAAALITLARNQMFAKEFWRRVRKVSWVAGFAIGILLTLGQVWPWIYPVLVDVLRFIAPAS